MAGSAGNTILIMGRTHEFALLGIGLVAGHATLGNCFRLYSFEGEDLALIATSGDVGRAGAMARLAAMNLFAAHLGQVGSVVRARLDVLEVIFMTALAGVGAHVL